MLNSFIKLSEHRTAVPTKASIYELQIFVSHQTLYE